MAAKTTKKTTKKQIEKAENQSKEISYKNYEYLSRFMNDRAKIFGQKQTGLSAKKQRRLTREIKRARHLGLLPYKSII